MDRGTEMEVEEAMERRHERRIGIKSWNREWERDAEEVGGT